MKRPVRPKDPPPKHLLAQAIKKQAENAAHRVIEEAAKKLEAEADMQNREKEMKEEAIANNAKKRKMMKEEADEKKAQSSTEAVARPSSSHAEQQQGGRETSDSSDSASYVFEHRKSYHRANKRSLTTLISVENSHPCENWLVRTHVSNPDV